MRKKNCANSRFFSEATIVNWKGWTGDRSGGNEEVGVEIWEGDSGMLWEEPTGFSSIVSRSNSLS